MFGTHRMIEALNRVPDASPKETLDNIRAAVDTFVEDAEQFDDLTMMCIEYKPHDETA
jgi:sigma-B regulation protein RsbU (phosphoserine phosphatase)